MVTFFEASITLMGLHNPTLPQRVHATVAWVRRSCEADLLPAWCVALVIANVERDILAGTFPLVPLEQREHRQGVRG